MKVSFPEVAQHAVVHTPYVPSAEAPVQLEAGLIVHVEAADPEYEHWFWCTTDDGRATHVPATYLDVLYPESTKAEAEIPSKDALLEQVRTGERPNVEAVLREDFNSSELSISPKDIVLIGGREAGWLYVRLEPSGTEGWVPASCIDIQAGSEFSRRGQGRHENERDNQNLRQGRQTNV